MLRNPLSTMRAQHCLQGPRRQAGTAFSVTEYTTWNYKPTGGLRPEPLANLQHTPAATAAYERRAAQRRAQAAQRREQELQERRENLQRRQEELRRRAPSSSNTSCHISNGRAACSLNKAPDKGGLAGHAECMLAGSHAEPRH